MTRIAAGISLLRVNSATSNERRLRSIFLASSKALFSMSAVSEDICNELSSCSKHFQPTARFAKASTKSSVAA